MTTTADFRALLDQFDAKMAESGAAEQRLKMFEDTLTSIGQGLADIVSMMEKPEDDAALIAAIQGIQVAPVINVAPSVATVNVLPAPVTVMPAANGGTISGTMSKVRDGSWAFSITRAA